MCVQESWRQGHITRKEMMHAMQLFPPSSGHANKGRTQSQTVVGNVVDGQLVKASSAHRSVHASHCPIVPCSCHASVIILTLQLRLQLAHSHTPSSASNSNTGAMAAALESSQSVSVLSSQSVSVRPQPPGIKVRPLSISRPAHEVEEVSADSFEHSGASANFLALTEHGMSAGDMCQDFTAPPKLDAFQESENMKGDLPDASSGKDLSTPAEDDAESQRISRRKLLLRVDQMLAAPRTQSSAAATARTNASASFADCAVASPPIQIAGTRSTSEGTQLVLHVDGQVVLRRPHVQVASDSCMEEDMLKPEYDFARSQKPGSLGRVLKAFSLDVGTEDAWEADGQDASPDADGMKRYEFLLHGTDEALLPTSCTRLFVPKVGEPHIPRFDGI